MESYNWNFFIISSYLKKHLSSFVSHLQFIGVLSINLNIYSSCDEINKVYIVLVYPTTNKV